MKLQILGKGCPNCQMLARNAQEAAASLGIDAEIEKITDMETMTEMGMLMSPGFAIDGMLVHSGSVLSSDKIEKILRERSTG